MWFPDRLRTTLWFCQAMVGLASLLVPRDDRTAWRSEQQRRFWHWCHFLSESQQLNPQNRFMIARSCWRLFSEAFWLRIDRERYRAASRRAAGSPVTVVLALAVAVAVLTLVSGIVPAVRIAFSAPVANAERVASISLNGNGINGNYSRTRSDTLLDLASIWQKSPLTEGLSPYSWAPANLLLQNRDQRVAAARVGANFFETLGIKPPLGRLFAPDDLQNCPVCVVLSYRLWQVEFHADPAVLGRVVDVNGSSWKVIGVLPKSFRLLSPDVAVWGLIDPAILFTNFQRRVGAVARLRDGTTPAALQRSLSDLTESAGYVHPSSQLQVVTLAAQAQRNRLSLLWFFLVATACAVSVALLRNLSAGFGHLGKRASALARWLLFLSLKSLLLVALAAVASWSLVHWVVTLSGNFPNSTADEYSIWLYLPLAIVALSWSIHDQRSRCRRCLRRLELPVEIGRTGSVLLNWAGTEMVCPEGHGVLYLPESPENSLDQDRWNNLDDSWQNLFRP